MSMAQQFDKPKLRASSGSWFLDEALGGGLPLGEITEIYGQESSGKTTMAMTICREVLKNGGTCFYFDGERKFPVKNAARIGLDTSQLQAPKETFEFTFENVANAFIRECSDFAKSPLNGTVPLVVVWDSMGGTQTAAEAKADIGAKPMDERPAMMRHFLTKLMPIISGTSILPVLINQTYVKYGGSIRFGENTPKGGAAQKQFPTVCLRASRGNKPIMDHTKSVLGFRHTIYIEKSEMGSGENVGFAITKTDRVGHGINDAYILFHELRDAGVIEQKASWSIMGDHKWQSTWIGFLDTMNANAGLRESLFSTYRQLKGGQDATVYLPKS
jgi:recombination protein RecA